MIYGKIKSHTGVKDFSYINILLHTFTFIFVTGSGSLHILLTGLMKHWSYTAFV